MKNDELYTLIRNTYPNHSDQFIIEVYETVKNAPVERYQKGDYVFIESDKSDRFFFILEGKVEIRKYTDMMLERIISILGPGNFFAYPEMYIDYYSLNASVKENAKIAYFSKEYFFKTVCSNNLLINHFAHQMGCVIWSHHQDMSVTRSELRILLFIRWLRDQHCENTQADHVPWKKPNITKLAEMLLLSRESASRTIGKLKKERLIDFDGSSFTILDPEKFDTLTKPYYLTLGFFGSEE